MKYTHLILELNSICNNNCIYCYIPKEYRRKHSAEYSSFFKSQIDLHPNVQNLDFTGGEPTLSKDLLELIRYSKHIGFSNRSLITNGRRLAYFDYAKNIIVNGINRVVISFDGHNSEIADKITNVKGGFKQVNQAINNIKKLGVELGLTLVVNRLNYRYIPMIIKKGIDLGADFWNIQFMLPYVMDENVICRRLPSSIFVSYNESLPFVKQALDRYTEKVINVHFIPYCFMEGYEDHLVGDSFKDNRLVVNYNGYTYSIGQHLKKGSVKLDRCDCCQWRNICIGFFKSYAKEFGLMDIIKRTINEDHDERLIKSVNHNIIPGGIAVSIFKSTAYFLINEFDISNRILFVTNIINILFQDVSSSFFFKNQKFDFSISSRSNSLRFSFNDFNERGLAYRKYMKVYSLFPNHCNLDLIGSIFDFMGGMTDHQITFGVEINEDKNKDRVKLYFEDFEYPQERVYENLNFLLGLLGFEWEKLFNFFRGMIINAIGIDFQYGMNLGIKIYTKHINLDVFNDDNMSLFQSNFPLNEDEFYLVAFRFSSDSSLLSKKVYKVNNFVKYENKYLDNCIERAIIKSSLGLLYDRIKIFNHSQNLIILPVLYSEDIDIGKTDIYFTLLKNINYID